MDRRKIGHAILIGLCMILLVGCGVNSEDEQINVEETIAAKEDGTVEIEVVNLLEPYKRLRSGNPLITHAFGADPYALVYEDRVYLYMTNDIFMYDSTGAISTNTYGDIRSLRCISSADLVNWTDHGLIEVGGLKGVTTWANNSWAPAAAVRNIEGKDQVFLYFANSASSIGVLVADHPAGPFRDPLGKPMITREIQGVADVTWLFDPAVLVDDDGRAYLYFGGGVPEGQAEMPNTARVIELGSDMVSTFGEAVVIEAPYIFENSGINKVGDTYYYSYCSNFSSRDDAKGPYVPIAGEIIYMTSENPMGPWTYQGSILKNPGHFFGTGGNNHHDIVKFKDTWLIFYHSALLQDAMGVTGGYRSTGVNILNVEEDGTWSPTMMDRVGVTQIGTIDPFKVQPFTMMANQAGISTTALRKTDFRMPETMVLDGIKTGSWIQVRGVDFGDATPNRIKIRYLQETGEGTIQVIADAQDGVVLASIPVTQKSVEDRFMTIEVQLETTVTGVKDLFFVFYGEDFQLYDWQMLID